VAERARRRAKMIQPEALNLPEELNTSPEKVEYWIDTYQGEHKISLITA